MNVADSEVVSGILHSEGYVFARDLEDADVVLLNTCAIRDNAEQRVYGRLAQISAFRKKKPELVVGILGCMAERLRSRLVHEEHLADIVVGPDEYRKLPLLLEQAFEGEKGIAVRLSRVENYEDIEPFRADGISAWISVMRGCDKFCAFCVVPFTRGRERSRSLESVVREVEGLASRGFKEVTLLGQNVNSYSDGRHDFADLIQHVAEVDRSIRVRFTTSHPQDMSDKLIAAIASNDNICNYIHLPVQSGSDRILNLMGRSYTVDHYIALVTRIRAAIPNVSMSTDIISGFPTETEDEHRQTLDLIRAVQFDGAYTFKYSPREGTKAWSMVDDVPEEEKGRRVQEMTELQHAISLEINRNLTRSIETVLVEGPSRKSPLFWMGRTDTNKTVVFPHAGETSGDYVRVTIERVNAATLFGGRASSSSNMAPMKEAAA